MTRQKELNRPDGVVLVLIDVVVVQSEIVVIYGVRDNFRIVHAQLAPLQFVLQISFGNCEFDITIS